MNNNSVKTILVAIAMVAAQGVAAQFKLTAHETSEKLMYAQYMQSTNSGTVTEVAHLPFKGMPIDGTLKGYSQKLKNKGFDQRSVQKNVVLFRGAFAGKEACDIYIAGKGPKVYMVGVMLSELVKPIEAQALYAQMVEFIKLKYGKESFQLRPEVTVDTLTNAVITQDKTLTSWVREKGTLELSIEREGNMCYVLLCYFDNVNYYIKYDATNIIRDL